MTFTQLEYIVAVDTTRHFAKAAAQCFVTQPTLSMQIQKLESDLGVIIFDRTKQPVVPTQAGAEIIAQARKILAERDAIPELIQIQTGVLQGKLAIGIIPTLAPYLLPLFIPAFTKKHPNVKLVINDLTTDEIINRLKDGRIDAGLLVTPLQETGIQEEPMFYEELLAYVSKNNAVFKKHYVLPKDIDPDKLLLLEEGHCFRSQMINLCELRKNTRHTGQFDYEAGSLETLRRLVELGDGITILPELATMDLPAKQQAYVRHFRNPAPVREVSIVTHRNYVKQRLVQALKKEVIACLPDKIRKNKGRSIIAVHEETV